MRTSERGRSHFGFGIDTDEDLQGLVLSGDLSQEPAQGESNSDFAKFKFNISSSGGRRHSNPRPWSLIGRKGPHSESSSLHQQLLDEKEQEIDVLSPNMLPTLFTSLSIGSKGSNPPLSPISLGGGRDGGGMGFLMPPTPPPEGDLRESYRPCNLVSYTD